MTHMNLHIDMLFPVTYECHMPSVLCRKFCILSRVIIKCPKSAKKKNGFMYRNSKSVLVSSSS